MERRQPQCISLVGKHLEETLAGQEKAWEPEDQKSSSRSAGKGKQTGSTQEDQAYSASHPLGGKTIRKPAVLPMTRLNIHPSYIAHRAKHNG